MENQLIELINKVDSILSTTEAIENAEQRDAFLNNNIFVFEKFNMNLHKIIEKYHIKKYQNEEHNKIVDSVKSIIARILSLKDVNIENFISLEELGDTLFSFKAYHFNQLSYKSEYKKEDLNEIKSFLEYLNNIEDYVKIINKKNIYIDEKMETLFPRDDFDVELFKGALDSKKINYFELSKEELIELMNTFENVFTLIEKQLSRNRNISPAILRQLDKKNEKYVISYSEIILKLKSILDLDSLKDDIIVKRLWNGEIKDYRLLASIVDNLSIDIFVELLDYNEKKSENGFIMELAEHFRNLNFSKESIGLIIQRILKKNINAYEIANFLANLPSNWAFIKGENAEKFGWVSNIINTHTKDIKEKIIKIENAGYPFLPAKYYIKKLDESNNGLSINKHIVGNLITLLYTDYYSQEEKNKLIEALKRNGLYNKYITDEEIKFEENDSIEEIKLNVKKAYYSGQVIPIEIAKKIINENLEGKIKIDKETLKGCIQSIISNSLKSKNIDIKNKVFFGKRKDVAGEFNTEETAIWINDCMLESYLNSSTLVEKAKLFEVMFHEMQHTIQFNNMKKGNFDYLTYSFLKEEIIMENDPEFYMNNYDKTWIELNSHIEQLLGTLGFFYGLNPEFIEVIKEDLEKRFTEESEKISINSDIKKKSFLGDISVSDYLGFLIRHNPKILEKNAILQTEYNSDGTRKDVQTLLNSFNNCKKNTIGVINIGDENFVKEVYSLYYGLISNQIKDRKFEDENLQKQIDEFMQEVQGVLTKEDLVKMNDCREYYNSSDKNELQKMRSRIWNEILQGKSETKTREGGREIVEYPG